jgi:DNA-binding transcriptional regulator YdaS (Cro superfamily)
MDSETPFARAVRLAGGQTEMAALLDVKQGQVWAWLKRNKKPAPPPQYCPLIEKKTGVTCEELRPDLKWDRNRSGKVVGYRVLLPTARKARAA